ncbi:MAG: hypothetical protein RQ723_03560 [Desulfuromonadales bacterium]|nr:hypothetical protein [Desulfuromonadales bacterium]
MADDLTDVEKKIIEFATKASATIQNQSEQIHALNRVLLVALVCIGEQNRAFRDDFIDRIDWMSERMEQQESEPVTRDYLRELVRFLRDPYVYASKEEEDRPKWFRGVIPGGRSGQPPQHDKED